MTFKASYSEAFFLKNIISFTLYTLNPRFLIIMAAMIGVGSLVFVAPFTGILLNFLVMAVSFKFAVDILVSSAEGNFDPKDVSFSDNDYLVVIQIIVIGILLNYLTEYVESSGNDTLSIFMVYGLQFIMPAIYMVLAYSGSLLEALNPITLIRFIKPWFFTYTLFSLFYLFTIFLETYGIISIVMNSVSIHIMYFISVFLMIFFLFLNFHIMGFLINQNFNESNDSDSANYSASSSKANSNRNNSNSGNETNPIYTRIQNLIESKLTDEAFAIINELQSSGDESEELKKLKQQAVIVSNQNTEVPLAEKIHHLILQNKAGSALKLLEEIYTKNETYNEACESDLGKLAKHAYNSQKFPLVLKLLNGFIKKYPNSREIVPNYYLVAQVLYKNAQTKSKALTILKGLVEKYPNHANIHEIKSWIKGIEIIQNKPKGYNFY